MDPPHWTAYISAIVLPIIALIAARIAFRQSQIARNKLKLDLFDRRMAVYEAVRKALGAAARNGKLTQEEEINYLVGISTAKWLFRSEVFTYLDETLWGKIVDLGLHNSKAEIPHGEERTEHIKAREETREWLVAQYKELDKLCAERLTLEH